MQQRTKYVGGVVAVAGLLAIASCGTTEKSTPTNNTTGQSTPGSVTSGTAASGTPAYAATLQTQIPEVMKANAIPGAIVMVKSRDKGNWSQTFGTAEIDKTVAMKLNDQFRIGSNTKTMTVTVILQLVQEGKLKLDDVLETYIPGFPNGDKITIAQLAEMRSGLYSYTSDLGFNETLDKEPQKAWTPDELLAIAKPKPPLFAPGAEYNYSNTNLTALGVIIEKLTGMSASDAFQKRIFEPLGLKNTVLPVQTVSTLPDPHPQGYQFLTNAQTVDSYAVPPAQLPAALDGTLEPINYTDANPSWAWTAGGAYSTADELSTYVKAMVGGKLLDEKTQKIRMDSFKPIKPGTTLPAYGLGLAQFAPNVYGHDGQIPGFASFMVYDPVTDTSIIIAVNLAASPVKGENASIPLGMAVMSAIYGASAVPGGDPAGGAGATGTTAPAGKTGTTTGR